MYKTEKRILSHAIFRHQKILKMTQIKETKRIGDWEIKYLDGYYIVRLSLLTMANPNQMRDVLLFVCSKMADETAITKYWNNSKYTDKRVWSGTTLFATHPHQHGRVHW